MISVLLILLEGMFNAVMDSVEYPAVFNKSIFKKYNPLFWSKVDSANNAFLHGTRFRIDAWHIAKFFAIFCVAMNFIGILLWPQITLYPLSENWIYIFKYFIEQSHWLLQILYFLILVGFYGLIRNTSFNVFYNKLLKSKP